MTHAFVIDWNLDDNWAPSVVDAMHHKNKCYFDLQYLGMFAEKAYLCYYTTKNAYNAKVLTRLMKAVQKFQQFCFVQNYCSYRNDIDSMVEYLETKPEYGGECNYGDHKSHEDIPFEISELNVGKNVNFKPCFFVHEYKINDKNGHPFYLVVMLERKDDERYTDRLFDYRIKFIGAGQPLSKLVERVPLCYDEEKQKFEQKLEKYKAKRKEYYDEYRKGLGKRLMNPELFPKAFETHTWSKREYKTFDGDEWTRVVYYQHDGVKAKRLFRAAFGDKVTDLVANREFNEKHFEKLPDISTQKFADAYNEFAKYENFRLFYPFDEEFKDYSYQNINYTIKRIETWAENPTSNLVPIMRDKHGRVVLISREQDGPEQEEITKPETPEMAMQALKTKLLYKRMELVKDPAILIKSPGKTKIKGAREQPYMDTDGKNYWDTNVDVWVEYKKQKSGKKQWGYRFTRIDLGYDFRDAMDNLLRIRLDSNLKWSQSKLFAHEDKSLGEDVDMDVLRRNYPGDDIMENVQKVNTDYNGVTILDPQNMKPIVCNHYELRTVKYHYGDSTNVLLFDKNNAITGIIYGRNINPILPHIITQQKQKG